MLLLHQQRQCVVVVLVLVAVEVAAVEIVEIHQFHTGRSSIFNGKT
jgi:hypothetical protein